MARISRAEKAGRHLARSIIEIGHLQYQNGTTLNFYRGLTAVLNAEYERRLIEDEERRRAEQLAKCKKAIASWPMVDFRDGTRPICIACRSNNIHRNPCVDTHWGCADCGYESTSPFISFCQEVACARCGAILSGDSLKRPRNCTYCNQKFKPPKQREETSP